MQRIKARRKKRGVENAKVDPSFVWEQMDDDDQLIHSSRCQVNQTAINFERILVDPNNPVHHEDFVRLAQSNPKRIFIIPDNTVDAALPAHKKHKRGATGGLAGPMCPIKQGNQLDMTVLGIPTVDHGGDKLTKALVKKYFAELFKQAARGNVISVPYIYYGGKEVPAFGGSTNSGWDPIIHPFIYKEFEKLEQYCQGKLSIKDLDTIYQTAIRQAFSPTNASNPPFKPAKRRDHGFFSRSSESVPSDHVAEEVVISSKTIGKKIRSLIHQKEETKEAVDLFVEESPVIRKGNLKGTFKIAFDNAEDAQQFVRFLAKQGYKTVTYFGEDEKYPMRYHNKVLTDIVRFEVKKGEKLPREAISFLKKQFGNENGLHYFNSIMRKHAPEVKPHRHAV